jgi:hypothetical protein
MGSSPNEFIGFFNLPHPSGRTYGPEVDSVSNRNEYQEFSWEVKGDRRVRLIISPPSVSRLSRNCGSLDLSQTYGPSRSVTGMALVFTINILIINN